ncbi:MAG: hypothetical protein AB1327_05110 [Bacillota bacterium]
MLEGAVRRVFGDEIRVRYVCRPWQEGNPALPAVVVNGQVAVSGRVPVMEIIDVIKRHCTQAGP